MGEEAAAVKINYIKVALLVQPYLLRGNLMKVIEFLITTSFWIVIFMCPLLILIAISFGACILIFGGETTVVSWAQIALSSIVSSIPISIFTSEFIRRKYGLVNFYSKLMNNRELNTK